MKALQPMINLPGPIWILSAATLVNRMGTMVVPFLTLYVIQVLGFSAKQAGVLVGTYGMGALIVSPVVGHLADRYGTLEIMVGSLLSSALVMFIFPFARSFAAL